MVEVLRVAVRLGAEDSIFFFIFQAGGGIQESVAYRGIGEVYKGKLHMIDRVVGSGMVTSYD